MTVQYIRTNNINITYTPLRFRKHLFMHMTFFLFELFGERKCTKECVGAARRARHCLH